MPPPTPSRTPPFTPRQAGAIGLVLLPLAAAAAVAGASPDTVVEDLAQRLAQGNADQVNRHLSTHWAALMQPLNRKTADCDLGAVRLAIELSRSTVARASNAHVDAIRAATGGCARFVLALAAPAEIPRYCASLGSWGPAQTARELRRRMALIDNDELLRGTQSGQACRAAYQHELQNTRVVLKKSG